MNATAIIIIGLLIIAAIAIGMSNPSKNFIVHIKYLRYLEKNSINFKINSFIYWTSFLKEFLAMVIISIAISVLDDSKNEDEGYWFILILSLILYILLSEMIFYLRKN